MRAALAGRGPRRARPPHPAQQAARLAHIGYGAGGVHPSTGPLLEARLGVAELAMPVGPHGATAVQVRGDQRPERRGRSSHGSSATRSSRVIDRSGRCPVAQTIWSMPSMRCVRPSGKVPSTTSGYPSPEPGPSFETAGQSADVAGRRVNDPVVFDATTLLRRHAPADVIGFSRAAGPIRTSPCCGSRCAPRAASAAPRSARRPRSPAPHPTRSRTG